MSSWVKNNYLSARSILRFDLITGENYFNIVNALKIQEREAIEDKELINDLRYYENIEWVYFAVWLSATDIALPEARKAFDRYKETSEVLFEVSLKEMQDTFEAFFVSFEQSCELFETDEEIESDEVEEKTDFSISKVYAQLLYAQLDVRFLEVLPLSKMFEMINEVSKIAEAEKKSAKKGG
jgi:hypothetical protein